MPEFERYEGESEEEFAERLALNRGKAMQDRFKVEEESVRLNTPKPFFDTAPVKDPNELESPEIEEPTLESPELEKPVTESFANFEEDEEPRKPRQIDPEATKRFYEEPRELRKITDADRENSKRFYEELEKETESFEDIMFGGMENLNEMVKKNKKQPPPRRFR